MSPGAATIMGRILGKRVKIDENGQKGGALDFALLESTWKKVVPKSLKPDSVDVYRYFFAFCQSLLGLHEYMMMMMMMM